MLFDDDEKYFGGTPQSKFMDIVLNANRNLVEHELSTFIKKYVALEMMLERELGEDANLEKLLRSELIMNEDKVNARQTDMFIELVGNILTQNE